MRTEYKNGQSVRVSLSGVAYDAIRAIPNFDPNTSDDAIDEAIEKITEEIKAQMDYNATDIMSDIAGEIIK